MTPYNTPIYNYLREYAKQNINIFHMPGHKLSKGIPQELAQDILKLDVTEIDGTDNLHYPEGIIKEAEELAAKAFGADKTFFLVNGSTCGIQAAIMSVCARGQKIIIGRDSHKSVVSGLILSGAEPVFVYPEYICDFGITGEITAKSIEKVLCQHPDAVAVLITRPNYYGICSSIEEISSLVHSHNKLLIVDEAHGAHLVFNEKLPPSAIKHGADICIQSAHKTLPALTQGAYLHVNGNRVDVDRLKLNLSMLQTSSPSYILMSYLDIARELMERDGEKKLDALIDEIEWFKKELGNYPEYRILTNSMHDSTRLVINISKLGISGYYAEKLLRERFKTQVEMADYENLVFITTTADNHDTFAALLNAMKGLLTTKDYKKNIENIYLDSNLNSNIIKKYYKELYNNVINNLIDTKEVTKKFTKAVIKEVIKEGANAGSTAVNDIKAGVLPYEAYMANKEKILVEECCGRICADVITPYPPGIPVLYPGEIIDERHIQYITAIIEIGGVINGITHNKCVQVIK
jgi:lysine decarboxylase